MGTATDVLVQQCKSIELLRDVEGGAPCCLGGRRRQGARVSIADDAERDALLRDEKREVEYRRLEGQEQSRGAH